MQKFLALTRTNKVRRRPVTQNHRVRGGSNNDDNNNNSFFIQKVSLDVSTKNLQNMGGSLGLAVIGGD